MWWWDLHSDRSMLDLIIYKISPHIWKQYNCPCLSYFYALGGTLFDLQFWLLHYHLSYDRWIGRHSTMSVIACCIQQHARDQKYSGFVCLQLRAVILHGNEIISKLCVIAVQMSTLWHQCKCNASYAPWARGPEDFMQCVWHSMGKGTCQLFFTTYFVYFLL